MKRKIYRIIKGMQFAFELLWKKERTSCLYLSLLALLNILNSFMLILFPKFLLDALNIYDYRMVFCCIGIYCIGQWTVTMAQGWISTKQALCAERNKVLLKTLLVDKLSTLRHEQMEDTEKLKQYDFAQKCVEEGSLDKYMQSVLSVVSAILVLSGVIYILKDLPVWVILLIVAVLSTNAVCNVISARISYKEMTEETPVERELYYYRGRLMNKEYGKEIRAYQLNDFISQKTKGAIEGFFSINQQFSKQHNRVLWWAHLVSGVQTFAVYIYNMWLFFRNVITIGGFMMNITALLQFSTALNTICSELIAIVKQSVYLEDYRMFLSAPSSYRGNGSIPQRENHVIEFVDISFCYPGQEQYALRNVNIKIRSGEKISIVGMNGAGKSTFVKLLMGLYRPTSGKILLDGIDIEEITPQEYLKLFSAVLQDYQLYSFTLLDNLLFLEQPSLEECDRAKEWLDKIGLDTVIEGLSDGMYSYLTQRYSKDGIDLSGGEHQKLAIARALYRDTPFMILDEPTSALSPQSEYDIYQRFSSLTENRTVFYISHRLASCTLCDRILVFEEGRIIEDGSHTQLLRKAGRYAQMFQKQASFFYESGGHYEGIG